MTLSSSGCGVAGSTPDGEVGDVSEALTPTQPFERRDIHELTAAQRTTLRNAILSFITQPVLDEHANGHDWHHPAVGELFFSRHHDYLNQLESYLLANGFSQFVPLPTWNPGTPIPSQFLVTDPLVSQAPLNANPNMSVPPQFAPAELCKFRDASHLAEQIEDWHDDVHGAVNGAMGSVSSAPGAPIFWLWHGLLDHLYHERAWRCAVLPALVSVVL